MRLNCKCFTSNCTRSLGAALCMIKKPRSVCKMHSLDRNVYSVNYNISSLVCIFLRQKPQYSKNCYSADVSLPVMIICWSILACLCCVNIILHLCFCVAWILEGYLYTSELLRRTGEFIYSERSYCERQFGVTLQDWRYFFCCSHLERSVPLREKVLSVFLFTLCNCVCVCFPMHPSQSSISDMSVYVCVCPHATFLSFPCYCPPLCFSHCHTVTCQMSWWLGVKLSLLYNRQACLLTLAVKQHSSFWCC